MSHVVLLGDSIFDNVAYTNGSPAVIDHLRKFLPPGWRCSLLARDGAETTELASQLERLPPDASHLVVSVGGNDVLWQAGVMAEPARSVAEALDHLADLGARFDQDYGGMIRAVLDCGRPTVLSTIYYPNIPEREMQRRAVALLSAYNDCIIRAAVRAGLPLLDLRLICNEQSDYANEIEPSASGGAKIAAAIARAVTEHDWTRKQTAVFAV